MEVTAVVTAVSPYSVLWSPGQTGAATTASCPSVNDTPRRAPRRFMLWAESVIGTFTSPWCWWQVPARGYRRGSGRLAGCALRRLRSIAPGENMRIHSYIIALLLFLAVVAIVSYVLLPS